MKKTLLSLISFVLVFSMVMSFSSCSKDPVVQEEQTDSLTTRPTTQPVEIVEIPESEEELAQMLNAAVEYIELYCYHYTKNIDCKVNQLSVGSLSKASNAAEAFRSIFGEKNITMNYDYNASRDAFTANFPASGYTVDEITSINAQQVDDNIVITATFPDESNPTDEGGVLHRLCPDYQNSEDVKKAMTDFSSSASSVSVSASGITIKATIRSQDSSLESLEVSYTQRYTLTGVTLVKLEGSAVTGTADTTVKYTDIGV